MNKTIPYRKAIYATQGLKTAHIKYTAKENISITYDKQLRKYRSRLAIDSLILFTEIGYRFSLIMTALMMLISGLMILYTVFIYIT